MQKIKKFTRDSVGELFTDGTKIYRGINENYITQTKEILQCGLIEEVSNLDIFPETFISTQKIDGYSLVLEHKKINHWNYPYEWSFDMLKDAALLVLKLNSIANKFGYEIKDGKADNVVFNMNKPQYIDFGSFGKIDSKKDLRWTSYEIFYYHFYIPLYLQSKGYVEIARNIFLMTNYFNSEEFLKIKYPIINLLLSNHTYWIYKHIKTIRNIALTSDDIIKEKLDNPIMQFIALTINKILKPSFSTSKIKKRVIALKKQKTNSSWNDYHSRITFENDKRFIRITNIIKTLTNAETLLDLSANHGEIVNYVFKNTHIKNIISTDCDIESINFMYLNNRGNKNFSSLLFDILTPNTRKKDKSVKARFKSDIVMGLALTHKLILKQHFPIDYIFETIKKLTNRYVILEFMPMGLYTGDNKKGSYLPDYYTLNWFKKNFKNYFNIILEESLELNRYVFIGEIKDN